MAQGKLKVKSKVPDSVAKKKKQQQQIKKGKVAKKPSAKKNNAQAQLTAKFKKQLHKKINANIEAELASVAQKVEEGKSFRTASIGNSNGGKQQQRRK